MQRNSFRNVFRRGYVKNSLSIGLLVLCSCVTVSTTSRSIPVLGSDTNPILIYKDGKPYDYAREIEITTKAKTFLGGELKPYMLQTKLSVADDKRIIEFVTGAEGEGQFVDPELMVKALDLLATALKP